jgi:hypothetical protein
VIPLHETQAVGGIGVVGASTNSLNPAHFAPVRDPEGGSGIGVLGTSGTGAGVRGSSRSGPGVQGEGQSGVVGTSSSTGFSGVSGQHTGSEGYGVVGDGVGSDSAGVLGRNSSGTGVWGEGSEQPC